MFALSPVVQGEAIRTSTGLEWTLFQLTAFHALLAAAGQLLPGLESGSPVDATTLRAAMTESFSGTDAQGEVTVRLSKGGRIVNGQGADTDIVVASARAYLNALNKLHAGTERAHPQV